MDTKAVLQKVENLDAKGLKDLLQELKLYQSLKKQLGKRGEDLFEKKHSGEQSYSVEYFPSVGEDIAWQQAQNIYTKIFNTDVSREKVKFIQKETLKGGIKVYVDDSMVDLSFAKIEQSIKN